ncbi:MAG: DUF1553 domain-containing protein [Planctomycetota bacterium]|nr:DUF1553 domain-containing protein [Planctomycetota bacterium]
MLSTLTFATLTFASMVFAAGPLAVVAPVPGPQLDVFPPAITLLGMDDAIQMVVSLPLANGRLSDRTRESKFQAVDPSLLRVTPAGRVIPLKNGSTTLRITDGALFREVAVKIQGCEAPIPIHFANQIVPIFTKLGCNSGGCHGKASGQNGFKISLLGYEPDVDYIAIVKEGRGRRVFPAAPEASLLLTKATGQSPHGGGKRLEVDSDEYKLLRRWIASGIPVGEATEPVVKRIQIVPEQRVLSRDSTQQFAVLAHYTNGRIEDITRRAQYESNETTIATVDPAGLVATHKIPGEAAIMARYQEYVTVFRATVPRSETPVDFTFPQQTLVDKHTAAKWKSLALTPSALSTDEQFLRRVSIDLTGTLPDPKRVSEFLADTRPNKRQVIVDELLDSAEFGYLFASKWADILRVKRSGDTNRAQGTFSFHGWIRQAMQDDMPFDQFSRAVISATGDEKSNPPALWTKSITQPEQFVDDTAQVFLGQRLACAQCHHHPYEKWSQDDYWSLAAFFGRIGRKEITLPGEYLGQPVKTTLVVTNPSGSVANKRTNKSAPIKALDAPAIEVSEDEDPRQKLADWMTSPTNPFFAKAVANRYWAHFFGRGIVDPLDDMRVTNPPTNPELLDALSQDFVKNGFSLKHLIRTIVNSRTYQLSSTPSETNMADKQNFARYYPRRMSAEILHDAVCQLSDSPAAFGGLPQDKLAPKRAIMLPDESYSSYFLDVFGKPQRISACECERVGEANLAQALHLLNSDDIQGKVARVGGRADTLATKDKRPDDQKVDDLFLWAFSHKPNKDQKAAALAHIAKHSANKKLAYENILWALMNSKEFLFVQ